MSKKKVIVIGLDGATFDLIGPWASEGKLPAFSQLMSEGVSGELESVPNQRSAAAWTSFMTGKNPGKHGIYEFYEYLPSSYNIRFINSRQRYGESLWRILSQFDKKVGVVNVPMTYPAERVNGFMIAGLDSPSVKSEGFTYPAMLYDTLHQKVGDYILEPGLTGAIVAGKVEEAIDLIKTELDQKIRTSRYLMANQAWDFFMVVFRSLDAVQHCFWKYMDPMHPGFQLTESRLYGDTILNTYQIIDGFLKELTASLDGDTTLVIMSDHGFGQKHPASNQLNQWLENKNLLTYTRASNSPGLLGKLYKEVVGKTPRKTKEWLWKSFPSLRNNVQSRLCFANIDWSKTRAYSDSLFPNIRINLKGRELHGIVEPGEEYEGLLRELISGLMDLREVNHNEKIVDKVFRREEIYHGDYTDMAPDLLIRWREDIPISGIKLNNHHHLEPFTSPIPGEDYRVISGDHHLNGIFLAHGKNTRKGIKIGGANIMDLAPTILSLMGIPVPDDMDGKVLNSIFNDSVSGSLPLSYDRKTYDRGETLSPEFKEYTEEEARQIESRLKSLGYI
jgi:predicted AlkP superfamily phosphohydrolase/phosphomutase